MPVGLFGLATNTTRVRSVTRGKDRIDVGLEAAFRRNDRFRAIRQNSDPVDKETVLGVNRLVSRPEIAARQKPKQFIRARAANDPVSVQPISSRDGVTQQRRLSVGVTFEFRSRRLKCFDCPRARPQRRLIGRQLCRLHASRHLAFAWHIGLDIKDAWTRDWSW